MKAQRRIAATASRGSIGFACLCVIGLAAFLGTGAPVAGAATPPDGRAYELVSPPEKNGAVPNFPMGGTAGLGFPGFSAMTGASEDGRHLLWVSIGAFAGADNGIPMSYLSSRTSAGWETAQASPNPVSEHPQLLLSRALIRDASPDFSTRIISSNEEFDPLIQGGLGGALKQNLFSQDAEGNLTWVSRPNSGPSTALLNALYEGSNPSKSHILFGTFEELVPAAAGQLGRGLYDRSGGQTVLVNVDDAGNPVHPCGARLGAIPNFNFPDGRVLAGAVSRDGSRIVFTAPDPAGFDESCADPAAVYVRIDDATTLKASASQRTLPDPLGTRPATFAGAVDGGGRDEVFFTSDEALTDEAEDGTSERQLLYRYDVPTETLTLLTPNDAVDPDVMGLVGASEDGSRLYLIAKGRLEPAAPADEEPKLYSYSNGDFAYVGSVPTADVTPLTSGEASRPVRVTPDGDRLLFSTSGSLRSFASDGHLQVYLYEASSDTLLCISCPGGAGAPTSDARLTSDSAFDVRPTLPRNLAEDGRRAYFETADALVPRDDNGATDVYEWNEGQLNLISGGHGKFPSFFADSGADGGDVFFVTMDRLAPQDVNADWDFYDARVGGGFPVPVAPALCSGEACQGAPSEQPPAAIPASSELQAGGNVNARRHRKHKKPNKRHKHKHRGHHDRRAAR